MMFPVDQKTPSSLYPKEDGVDSRVTTSVRRTLANPASAGTCIPWRCNGRTHHGLSQQSYPTPAFIRAAQKPSSALLSLSLSAPGILCKRRIQLTLFFIAFAFCSYKRSVTRPKPFVKPADFSSLIRLKIFSFLSNFDTYFCWNLLFNFKKSVL